METKVLTIDRLKELITEIFYDKTDKVTKVTDNSGINALFYGTAKAGQKALVDIANVEAQLFPEFATGTLLDEVAVRLGVAPRFSASGSSTFLRLVGAPGTQYLAATNSFKSTSGIIFDLSQDVTIPQDGYIYANVGSRDVGIKTNVVPNSINSVVPVPTGHDYVINEFQAIRGANDEDDQSFRQRIINYPNLLSESTLEKMNQIFIKTNNNVLRTIYKGLSTTGKNRLGILTQDGSELSVSELGDLLSTVQNFIAISDLRKEGNNIVGIELENIDFYPIDVDFRVDIIANYDPDSLRVNIQTQFARLVDYRFWEDNDTVQWDDLLEIVKSTQGVRSVPDKRFFPQTDVEIPIGQFPRFRSFIMRDLTGAILIDQSGLLDPVFFSNSINEINNII
jgi:hypothetical protein